MTIPAIDNQLALITRGVAELISPEELASKLRRGTPLRVKAGFDPTAPDLHLGHTVVMQKLRQFQDLGHHVIFLIGDFTARIGDPSGRSATRPALQEDDIARNVTTYTDQAFHLLDRAKTEIVYNSAWLGKMSVLDFAQLGSHYTVARMLERDDFKKRIAAGTDVSLLEFYYPLMQAYDSVVLKADVEIGGTDQKFNLLLGRTIQRRYGLPAQVVLTMPLLVGTDGVKKMSKTYGNHIAIQDPPATMFGKLMSISDPLMWDYYTLLSACTPAEIEARKAGHPKAAKVALAREIVARFHSTDAADAAAAEFERVFARKENPEQIAEVTIAHPTSMLLVDAIMQCGGAAKSKSELRRLITQRAVRVDDQVVTDVQYVLQPGRYLIQVGKRWHNTIILKKG